MRCTFFCTWSNKQGIRNYLWLPRAIIHIKKKENISPGRAAGVPGGEYLPRSLSPVILGGTAGGGEVASSGTDCALTGEFSREVAGEAAAVRSSISGGDGLSSDLIAGTGDGVWLRGYTRSTSISGSANAAVTFFRGSKDWETNLANRSIMHFN